MSPSGLDQFLAPTWQFTMVYNFSPRGSIALFWPLSTLHARGTETYMYIKRPYKQNNFYKKMTLFIQLPPGRGWLGNPSGVAEWSWTISRKEQFPPYSLLIYLRVALSCRLLPSPSGL